MTQGIPGILEGTRLDYLGYPEAILDCQFMIMNDRSVKLVLFQHFFKMQISIECIQLNSDIIVKDCESTDHPIAQELVIRS